MTQLNEAGKMLIEYAHKLIEVSKATLRSGSDVLPAIVTANSVTRQVRIYGLAGPSNAVMRQLTKERMVQKDGADAVLFFADAWRRDAQTMLRTGEMLTGTVETKEGACVSVICPYDREPELTFHEVIVTDQSMSAGNTFGGPVH